MTPTIRELFDIVAAGDDLAAKDAAFLCQRLDPFLWHKALQAAGEQDGDQPKRLPSSSVTTEGA